MHDMYTVNTNEFSLGVFDLQVLKDWWIYISLSDVMYHMTFGYFIVKQYTVYFINSKPHS